MYIVQIHRRFWNVLDNYVIFQLGISKLIQGANHRRKSFLVFFLEIQNLKFFSPYVYSALNNPNSKENEKKSSSTATFRKLT